MTAELLHLRQRFLHEAMAFMRELDAHADAYDEDQLHDLANDHRAQARGVAAFTTVMIERLRDIRRHATSIQFPMPTSQAA